MNNIRIEYYVNDNPITDVRHNFDYEGVKSIADHYQAKLIPFCEKINEQNGYLKLNISNPKEILNGFHFEISVRGINEKLNAEINDSEVFNWH